MANYNNYSDRNEKKGYAEYLWSSNFNIDNTFVTDPGSGSVPNSQLVQVAARHIWPVSTLGDQLQNLMILPAHYHHEWSSYALALPEEQHEAPILTTKDKLEEIRDIFGLSISHLAKVLCTSRPSLHSWLEGGEPRDLAIERITQIYQLAKTWKDMSPYHYSPSRLMRQPLGNGPSMLERLERETLIDAEISDGLDKLLQLMHRQHEQMERSKKRRDNSTHPDRVKTSTTRRLTRTVYSSSE